MWHLAGPLIVSNISIALLGLVDTAVVGHLDEAYYLGGIAVGTIIFDFIYWGMGFFTHEYNRAYSPISWQKRQ